MTTNNSDFIIRKDQIIQICNALDKILDKEVVGSGEVLESAIKTKFQKWIYAPNKKDAYNFVSV